MNHYVAFDAAGKFLAGLPAPWPPAAADGTILSSGLVYYPVDCAEADLPHLQRVEGAIVGGSTPERQARQLQALRDQALAAIRAVCGEMRRRVAGTEDQLQIDGWGQKALAADRLLAAIESGGQPAALDLSILEGECEARGLGETPAGLAAAIRVKARRHTRAAGVIDGLQDRYEKLAASGTAADIAALPDALRDSLAARILNDPAP